MYKFVSFHFILSLIRSSAHPLLSAQYLVLITKPFYFHQQQA